MTEEVGGGEEREMQASSCCLEFGLSVSSLERDETPGTRVLQACARLRSLRQLDFFRGKILLKFRLSHGDLL